MNIMAFVRSEQSNELHDPFSVQPRKGIIGSIMNVRVSQELSYVCFLGWSKKHQFFWINFFFWIGVRNVLKLPCVKYFYLIPSRNVPTLQSKFPYFQSYLPKQTSFG